MLILITLNSIPYKIFVCINKIYLCICSNLIMYVIVTELLIIQYICLY